MTIRVSLVVLLLGAAASAQAPEPFALDLIAVSTSLPDGVSVPAVRCDLVRRYRVVDSAEELAVVGERGGAPWLRSVEIRTVADQGSGRFFGGNRRVRSFSVQATMRVRRGSWSSGTTITEKGAVVFDTGEWFGSRSGGTPRIVAILPAPSGAGDVPDAPSAAMIADTFARLVIDEERPESVSNELLGALSRLPLLTLLDPRVRDTLTERLRTFGGSGSRRGRPSVGSGMAVIHGSFEGNDLPFVVRMAAGDESCFDDWEGLAARAEMDWNLRRNLPLAWVQTESPELRGKIAAVATYGRNVRAPAMSTFLGEIVSALDAKTAVMPGTPEQQSTLSTRIRALAGELNYRPALLVISAGAATLAALAFLSRRLLRF